MRIRVLGLAPVIALGACAHATGPIFRPVAQEPGSAIVYVYRTGPARPLRGGSPGIYVNGEKKFDLPTAGYGVITLPPGQHEIKAEGKFGMWMPAPATRTIAVEAVREYYIRINSIRVGNFETRQAPLLTEMIQVPRDEALKELSKTRSVTETDPDRR